MYSEFTGEVAAGPVSIDIEARSAGWHTVVIAPLGHAGACSTAYPSGGVWSRQDIGTGLASITVDASGLSGDCVYWAFSEPSGGGPPFYFSEECRPITFCVPPSPPALTVPSNGFSTDIIPITLEWDEVTGADFYVVRLSGTEWFTEWDTLMSHTNSVTFSPEAWHGLGSPSEVFWKVRSGNYACGMGDFSPSRYFEVTVEGTVAPPGLRYPYNGYFICDVTPRFMWYTVAGATSYMVEVDDDPAFGSPEILQDGLTSYYWDTPTVLPFGEYHWRMYSHNSEGYSDPSAVRTFTLGDVYLTLNDPPDMTVGSSQTITWSRCGGSTVNIFYRTSPADGWRVLAMAEPNDGAWGWTPVANTPTDSAQIMIEDAADGDPSDISTMFRIIPEDPNILFAQTFAPDIILDSREEFLPIDPGVLWANSTLIDGTWLSSTFGNSRIAATNLQDVDDSPVITYRYGESGGDVWLQYWLYFTWADIPAGYSHFSDFRAITLLWNSATIDGLTESPRNPDYVTGSTHFFRNSESVSMRGFHPVVYIMEGTHSISFAPSDTAIYYRDYPDFMQSAGDEIANITRRRVRDHSAVPEWETGWAASSAITAGMLHYEGRDFAALCEPAFEGIKRGGLVNYDGYSLANSANTLSEDLLLSVDNDICNALGTTLSIAPGDTGYSLIYYDAQEWRNFYGYWGEPPSPRYFPTGSPKTPYFMGEVFSDPASWAVIDSDPEGIAITREGGLSGTEIILQDGEGRVSGFDGAALNMLPGALALGDDIYIGKYALTSDRLALRITDMGGTGNILLSTSDGDSISFPLSVGDNFRIIDTDWDISYIDTISGWHLAGDIVDPVIVNNPPDGDTITNLNQLYAQVGDSLSRINLATADVEVDSVPRTIHFNFEEDRLLPQGLSLDVGWHTIEARIEDLARNAMSRHTTFYWDTTPPPVCDWLFHLYSGGTGDDVLYSVTAMPDSGFVVSGLTESFGTRRAYLARYNSGMDRLWARSLSLPTDIGLMDMDMLDGIHARGIDIARTDDGIYIASSADGEILISLISDAGDLLWAKTVALGDGNARAVGIAEYGTGCAVVGNVMLSGEDRIALLTFDEDGNIVESHAIDYAGNFATAIEPAFDGGLFITGQTAYHEEDMLIIRLDDGLDIEWMRAIGHSTEQSWAEGIVALSDGSSIISGWTEGYGAGGKDGVLLRLNHLGFTDWIKAIGTIGDEFLHSVTVVEDSFVVAVGSDVMLFGLDGGYLGGYNEYATDVERIFGRRFIVTGGETGTYGGLDFTLSGGDSAGWMCTGTSPLPDVNDIAPDFNFRVLLWEGLSPVATEIIPEITDLPLTADFTCKCDTTAPTVTIACTGDTLNVGIETTFTWTITDDFPSAAPCSVYIGGCGVDIRGTGSGSFAFTPDTMCEYANIEVVCFDVWGNRGSDICWFPVENACFAELFDVSVDQEIACDGESIVDICYTMTATCVESSYTVEAEVYPDSTMDWTVPFVTRREDAGDLGPGIEPGTHCFQWDMGEDWHGAVGDDFRLVLSYLHEGHVETAETVVTILDTRSPNIRIGSRDVETYWVGSTYTMNFTESEDYPTDDPYQVDVSWCSGDTSFTLPRDDHSHPFPVTVEWGTCDTVYFVVSARDSFCNVGLDSLWLIPRSSISISPDNFENGAVFSCADFAPSFNISSHCPLDTTEFYMTIDGTYYTIMDTEIDLLPTGLTFTPTDSLFWSEGEHTISVHLEDVCGNIRDYSVSIFADYTPPALLAWGPTGDIPWDTEWLWVVARDSVTNISDLRIEINSVCEGYILGPEDVVAHGDTLFIPIENCEDIVEICVKAWDNPAICEQNADSLCWTYFLEGIFGECTRQSPLDENGDGRIVSNCEAETLSWHIQHTQRLDLASIGITVNGEVFLYPTFMEFSRDTIYFSPDTGFLDSEPLEVCLRYVMDISGSMLTEPVCDTMYFDRSPPYLEWASPGDGDIVYDTFAVLDGAISDLVCPDPFRYIWLETSAGHSIEASEFPLTVTGLSHGDTGHVFIIAQDTCADYCPANVDTFEWEFYVDLGAPRGRVTEPDMSGGVPVCACSSLTIGWTVTDPAGLDTLSPFRVNLGGIVFERHDLIYEFFDESLHVALVTDSFGLDMTSFEGDTISFCLDSVLNLPGFDLREAICASILPDFTPPVFYDAYPPPEYMLFGDSLDVRIDAEDDICSDDVLDSITVRITPLRSGWEWDGTSITGLEDGDRVWITAHASDCPDICPPNRADTTWGFDVVYGSIFPTASYPQDINGDGDIITGCPMQICAWQIFHTEDIDTLSAIVTVDGDSVGWASGMLALMGDSLFFMTDSDYAEGEHRVCLVGLADVTGSAISGASCTDFTVDITPPVITQTGGPLDGTTIYTNNFTATFSAMDDICDSVGIDSIAVLLPWGREVSDSCNVSGLSDGDSVVVTAYSSDNCRDYSCEDETSRLSLAIYVAIGGLSADILYPEDINGDGRIISTCQEVAMAWLVVDEYPLLDGTVNLSIDGTPVEDSLVLVMGDTVYTEIILTEGLHNFCLDMAVDITGERLPSPVCGEIIIDTEGAYPISHSPTGLVTSDSILFNAVFRDDICADSVELDSVRVTITDSLGAITYNLATTFLPIALNVLETGDSIYIACYTTDNCADYCDGNHATAVFGLHVGYTEPYAELVTPRDANGDGIRWSACGERCFTIEITDSAGLVTEGLHLSVDDTEYRTSELAPILSPDSVSMEIELCGDWEGWIYITLDSAFNRTGQKLERLRDRMLFMADPPSIEYTGPEGTIFDSTALISYTASDSLCSLIVLDSLLVTVTDAIGDTISHTAHDTSALTLEGLGDGQSVNSCAFFSSHCADTCQPLSGILCNDFDVVIGDISASLISPSDRNGDGRIITSCDDSEIRWHISSRHPIETESIEVTSCGMTYVLDSPELGLFCDTLVLSISEDSCEYCLTGLSDTLGNPLPLPVCANVIWDNDPPVVTSFEPSGVLPPGIHHFSASAYDSICGDEIEIFHSITLYPGGDTTVYSPSFDLYLDCDSLRVCILLSDLCADTCSRNIDTICRTIAIDMEAPGAELLEPLVPYSSCSDQSVIWRLSGDYVPSSIRVNDGSAVYSTGYDGLYLAGDRLIFEPYPPGTEWPEGEPVTVCIDSLSDSLGNGISGFCAEWIGDYSPPLLFDPSPVGIVSDSSILIEIDIADSISGAERPHMEIDGAEVSSIWDGFTLSFDTEGWLSPENGDTLEICVTADDLAEICPPNIADTCWQVFFGLSGPVIEAVYPDEGSIVSCREMDVLFSMTDPDGIADISATLDDIPITTYELTADTLTVHIEGLFGEHSVCVCAFDSLGNISDTVCISFTTDTIPPVIIFTAPEDTTFDLRPTISAIIVDSLAGRDSISMTVDGELAYPSRDGDIFRWQPETELGMNRFYDICITAWDRAGLCPPNSAYACRSIYIQGRPDLFWADSIVQSPQPPVAEGDTVMIAAFVVNDSLLSTGSFSMGLFEGDRLIESRHSTGLGLSDTAIFTALLLLPAGEHELCFVADLGDSVIERDEENNVICTEIIISGTTCNAEPNPFSPNGDGINEYVDFTYPRLLEGAEITVFDLDGAALAKFDGEWDGLNSDGKPLPRGVYLYTVERKGDVICKGTLYLLR